MLLIYIFATVVAINCLYYLLFSKFSFHKPSLGRTTENFSISLIICAKNEAENLRKNIPLWLSQEYENLEFVFINDASADDTLEVMKSFQTKDARIRVVDVENNEAFWGNKKYALTLGIKRATSKRMLFTDADCRPASNHWVKEMASHFSPDKQLVLGYGAYEKKSGPLNALIRFETLMTAVQYFSYAMVGKPYMGVGRNLGYTSTIYYANNGFMSHIKLPSGDDDLFVNEVATAKNVALSLTENSFTYSEPKTTIREWLYQKRRHITTSKYYKKSQKLLLGVYYVANLLFWVLVPFVFMFQDWEMPVILLSARILLMWFILGKAALKLNEKNLIPVIPFLELFLVSLQLTIFISNTKQKPNHWS